MGKIRRMSYNGTEISVEDTAATAKLMIDGKEADRLGSGSKKNKLELNGVLPTGEPVKVQIYGIIVGKFRLIIGERVITEDW